MVQTDELQRTKKKQTNLISPTSLEIEYFREDFSTDKEKFQVFRKVTNWPYLYSNKTEYLFGLIWTTP